MADTLSVSFRHAFPRGGPRLSIAFEADLGPGRITVLFGPSGSGKTSALRAIAGLLRPDEGRIVCGDACWSETGSRAFVPPERRAAGLVFQEGALFPHADVARNVGWGLRRLPASARATRVASLLERLGLSPLAGRRPSGLSGGERQRVALARALAPRPRLLLLDEPLASLDLPAREELRRLLRALLREEGVPSLLVTHDRLEALALGDRVVVLEGGVVRQAGPVDEVFSRPATPAVARAVGVETVVPARLVERRDGLALVAAGRATLRAVDPGREAAESVLVCIRAEEVLLERGVAPATSARNRLPARVLATRVEGPLVRVDLDAGFPLAALVTRAAAAELALAEGEEVVAVVKAPAVHLVPRS